MSQIKQVKDSSDIVQIIGERISLQRAGTNYKAPCPFHSEKTPSFFVNEVLQRYKCFGCGENGDIFTFLEKYEGMSFAESLRYLAERAGIKLEQLTVSPEDQLRDRLLEILDLTKAYFHFLLTKHEVGEVAREYLKQRGVTQESIKVFQLGFAMPGWDGLLTYLHDKKKYSLSDIEKAGLIISGRSQRYYDRFRGRIMFPLTNHRGQTVGFSGRVLDANAKEAKYINTPETALYHKSELLYGYSQLYQEIRKANEVIVAEGELDVISSAQAHVNNVVAIKGSALTKEQLQLLRRTVNRVLLSLDMDSAGVEATRRAITLAQEFDLELRVISIPGGKDPDELARKDPAGWREATDSAISVYEFFLQHAVTQFNPKTPEGKRQIIDQLAPIFGVISHAVEQDFYFKKLAQLLGVSDEVIKRDIAKFKDKGKLFATRNIDSHSKQQESPAKSRVAKLEEYVLFLLLRHPEERIVALAQQLYAYTWHLPGAQQLVQSIRQVKTQFQLAPFIKNLPEDMQQLVSDTYLHPEYIGLVDQLDLSKEWQRTMTDLSHIEITSQIDTITKELDTLDAKREKTAVDDQRQAELLKQIVLLKRQIPT